MQKDIFMSGEGDAYLKRNRDNIDEHNSTRKDLLLQELSLLKLPPHSKVLEIGCGEGSRLVRLKETAQWECYGVEPSADGVALANSKGITAIQGTAEKLDWEDNYFDVVIFGCCLYLCDRADLFKIAAEANRVLKNTGWLAILDFYSDSMYQNEYRHYTGLKSYKMDYRTLFTWHPFYTCYSHKVVDPWTLEYTDEKNQWMAVSILRKKEPS